MLRKIWNNLRHKFIVCSFLIFIALGTAACQIFYIIPILIIQLPLRILGLAFQMLPYLIKFAPLALLFLEGKGDNAAEYYVSLPQQAPCVAREARFSCYLIDLSDKQQAAALVDEVGRKGGRMVFVKEASFIEEPGVLSQIHQQMQKSELQFAYDERVLEEDSTLSKKSFNV
jgi:hypothetical protein